MTRFGTDKESPHGYLPDYLWLTEAIGPGATICEVGVERGASLAMWLELVPGATVIGVDHNPSSGWLEGTHRVVAGQDDPGLGELVREHAPDGCDLVVDDASHIGHLSAATFAQLWPLVKPNGYYVVEDWADPWVFPDWKRWPEVDPSLAGDELIDWVPSLITALKDGAQTVTYTSEGLVIIMRRPA